MFIIVNVMDIQQGLVNLEKTRNPPTRFAGGSFILKPIFIFIS